ncbi:MAG: uncharacterized protein JWP06_875 [Candidatus Saccharibacteria bacterium]|nr:uncharacterized protein [Candidatus Saccharibacteria bacterium]
MFIVGILSWWYGPGWRQRVARLGERLNASMDYFSIDLLVRTFFAPFRQISAGKVRGPLGVQMRAFLDRIISRIIGAMIRFIVIIIGSITICFHGILGMTLLVVWAIIPLMPVIGIILFATGWIPWSL